MKRICLLKDNWCDFSVGFFACNLCQKGLTGTCMCTIYTEKGFFCLRSLIKNKKTKNRKRLISFFFVAPDLQLFCSPGELTSFGYITNLFLVKAGERKMGKAKLQWVA